MLLTKYNIFGILWVAMFSKPYMIICVSALASELDLRKIQTDYPKAKTVDSEVAFKEFLKDHSRYHTMDEMMNDPEEVVRAVSRVINGILPVVNGHPTHERIFTIMDFSPNDGELVLLRSNYSETQISVVGSGNMVPVSA